MTDKDINTMRNTARYYDLDTRDNLTDDIPFYLSYAAQAGQGVLELGCGTGRVSIPLARAGYEVTGLDLSSSMLDIFREKLSSLDGDSAGRLRLVQGDMSRFELDRKYGLIISPFRAFQALTQDEDIKSSLSCVREHLTQDGVFIINVFQPYPVMDESWLYPERVQWEEFDTSTGAKVVKKHWGDRIDTVNQVIYPHYAFEVTYPDGRYDRITDDLALKYYYPAQLRDTLERAGLRVPEEYGWYDKSPLEGGRETIYVCGKGEIPC